MDLEFFDTPQPFLDVAGDLLAADPVLGSVIASVTQRTARELADGRDSWAEVDAPVRPVVARRPRRVGRGGQRGDADRAVQALPDLRDADVRRGRPRPRGRAARARGVPRRCQRRPARCRGARPGDRRAGRRRDGVRQGDPALGGHVRRGAARARGHAAPGHRGRRRAGARVVHGLPRGGRRAGRPRARPDVRRAQHPRQRPGPDPRGGRVAVGAARRHGRAPHRLGAAVLRRRAGSARSTRRRSTAAAASRRTSWAS